MPYYRANAHGKTSKESYSCGKYSLGRGECTAHYIRESVQRDIVLEQIKYMTSYVGARAVDFADEWLNIKRGQREKELRSAQKRFAQTRKRKNEIDDLLMRVYEDYVQGVLKQPMDNRRAIRKPHDRPQRKKSQREPKWKAISHAAPDQKRARHVALERPLFHNGFPSNRKTAEIPFGIPAD